MGETKEDTDENAQSVAFGKSLTAEMAPEESGDFDYMSSTQDYDSLMVQLSEQAFDKT